MAHGFDAGAFKLDPQGEPVKNVVEFTRNFRFPFSPSHRGDHWFYLAPVHLVGTVNHHGAAVPTLFGVLLFDEVV